MICSLTWLSQPRSQLCSSPKPESPLTVTGAKTLTPSSVGDLHFSSHLRLSCASVLASMGLYLGRFPPTLYSRNAKKQKELCSSPFRGHPSPLIPISHLPLQVSQVVRRWEGVRGLHTLIFFSGFPRQSKTSCRITYLLLNSWHPGFFLSDSTHPGASSWDRRGRVARIKTTNSFIDSALFQFSRVYSLGRGQPHPKLWASSCAGY